MQALPQALPDPARFPAPEAHIDRVPVTKLRRQIAPRAAGAQQVEQGFEELPIGYLTRGTGRGVFGSAHRRFELLPDGIGDDFAHRMFQHPKLPS